MDIDTQELIRRLFVVATETIEDIHEVATAGQAPDLGAAGAINGVDKLEQCAAALGHLTQIIRYLASRRDQDETIA